jgi:hypothetical protein
VIEGDMDVIRHTIFNVWHDIVLRVVALCRALTDSEMNYCRSFIIS